MDLAYEALLLAYYLLLGEPDLLRHRISRSVGQQEEKEDNFQVDVSLKKKYTFCFLFFFVLFCLYKRIFFRGYYSIKCNDTN